MYRAFLAEMIGWMILRYTLKRIGIVSQLTEKAGIFACMGVDICQEVLSLAQITEGEIRRTNYRIIESSTIYIHGINHSSSVHVHLGRKKRNSPASPQFPGDGAERSYGTNDVKNILFILISLFLSLPVQPE